MHRHLNLNVDLGYVSPLKKGVLKIIWHFWEKRSIVWVRVSIIQLCFFNSFKTKQSNIAN